MGIGGGFVGNIKFLEEERTNVFMKIKDKICSYKKQCKIKSDMSGDWLCKHCKYYKTDFNIPKIIDAEIEKKRREKLG